MAGKPKLSIVVVPFAGEAYLERCLAALDAGSDCEVIVPREGLTPAARRGEGVRAARAPVIAVLEDHVIPAKEWPAKVLAAHARGGGVIGGAIAKRRPATAMAWALWLADFSRYAPSRPAGRSKSLSDIHVTYKREALEECGVTNEIHEHLLHKKLANQLWFEPSLLVEQDRTMPLTAALRERFHHGRLFGATRRLSVARRVLLLMTGPLLPPLLLARALAADAPLGAKLFALPVLVLICSAWAAGEWWGAMLPSKLPEA